MRSDSETFGSGSPTAAASSRAISMTLAASATRIGRIIGRSSCVIVGGSLRFPDQALVFGLLAQTVRVLGGHEVPPVRHRVEAHCVKVGDHDLVAIRRERRHGRAHHGAVEARRLVVCTDDEYAHRVFLMGWTFPAGGR